MISCLLKYNVVDKFKSSCDTAVIRFGAISIPIFANSYSNKSKPLINIYENFRN